MRSLPFIIAAIGLGGLSVASDASAQSIEEQVVIAGDDQGESAENLDALPGVFRITAATPLRPGVALGLTAGYGYTEDVLQLEDTHHRMRGAIAASYRPTRWLAAGLRLDGRYDRHQFSTASMTGSDDGWVGEARVNLLASHRLSETMGLGLSLVGWLPGGFSGLSLDAKAIGTMTAGPAVISANLGFRLDRSAETVDDPDRLSTSDRLALGVSDSNALLVGVGAETKLGPISLLGEITWDVLIGDAAPPVIESPLRLGAGARFAVSDSYSVAAMLEGSLGRAPFVAAMQPLVPVEPLFGISITVSQRPASAVASADRLVVDSDKAGDDDKDTDKDVKVDPRATQAGISGTVRDGNGEPIRGAVVLVAGREVLTGDDGSFVAEKLDPGQIAVTVTADGFGQATESVRVAKDEVRTISIILKRLETGTLRGVVRGFDGSPLSTSITITPGDYTVSSDGDGSFQISLPAGEYTATATAKGFRSGSARATITVPGPVVIVNLELQKAR